ncbi:diiron oxygenase [Nocardioides humilatus]|uniref:Diiron oxygenase n=1 Tax=Nocardioides humilatus TaxID=2607660 RepID=A0A5B1LG89_9ACTN|nr:diiron oxygenase [Nocardioides humilatus]KAA1419446.1 diiron oxygenase [Nocardioides humilatus]
MTTTPERTKTTPVSMDTVAERLINGSVRRSYEPAVAIDWDAPLVEGKYFLPKEVVSLYGTAYWEEMTEEQRIELSRQEMTNILSVGIWFENILNRGLLLQLMREDPSGPFAHYVLTEMGDECRHMTMFGKVIARMGAKPFRLGPVDRIAAAALPHFLHGSLLWVGALIGEEIFDAQQRRIMTDPELQPVVAQLMKIHVTEEARHIKFAREGVVHRMQDVSRLERFLVSNLHGLGGPMMKRCLVHRGIYHRAGLDVDRAYREAMANPHHLEMARVGFAPLAAFLEDNGLMTRFSRRLWKRSGFLA